MPDVHYLWYETLSEKELLNYSDLPHDLNSATYTNGIVMCLGTRFP